VIRLLWQGGSRSHHARHYTVENVRIYTLPPAPPPIYVAASGAKSAEAAARIGDGLISTSPKKEILASFETAGGDGPRYGQVTVCYAADEKQARSRALEWWPTAAVGGELGQELRCPPTSNRRRKR